MTAAQTQELYTRIDKLTYAHKASFGKMNVNQMICHCSDFFRMANGEKKADEYDKMNPNEIKALAKAGKSITAPKGFGQVEGYGTKPTHLENDKQILKEYIQEFSKFTDNFIFSPHPFFGEMDHKHWVRLAVYHLNHHLTQFNA